MARSDFSYDTGQLDKLLHRLIGHWDEHMGGGAVVLGSRLILGLAWPCTAATSYCVGPSVFFVCAGPSVFCAGLSVFFVSTRDCSMVFLVVPTVDTKKKKEKKERKEKKRKG